MSSRFTPLILGLALAAAPFVPAQAQQPGSPGGPIKIAVIDTEKILLGSNTGKKALADLKKLQEAKEAEGRAKQQEIKDLQAKLTDGRLSLSQDKLADMEKQLEDKMVVMRRFQEDANAELGKKRDQVLAQIDQRVMPVINQLGKEMGYTLIFRKFESGLIYADEAVDITGSVIQKLDAAAPAPTQGK
jgi:outer membrane protein